MSLKLSHQLPKIKEVTPPLFWNPKPVLSKLLHLFIFPCFCHKIHVVAGVLIQAFWIQTSHFCVIYSFWIQCLKALINAGANLRSVVVLFAKIHTYMCSCRSRTLVTSASVADFFCWVAQTVFDKNESTEITTFIQSVCLHGSSMCEAIHIG